MSKTEAVERGFVSAGQQYGRWFVLESHPNPKSKGARCLCSCGTEKLVERRRLRSGESQSCGCLRRELISKREKTHGLGSSAIYKIWNRAVSRCHNPSDPKYPRYGARGIFVCERWRTSVENFVSDVGHPPFPGATLDRIDNDGPYEPSNVRWTTAAEQSLNKACTRRIEVDGRSVPLLKACQEAGISEKTVRSRLKLGWSLERALNSPVDRRYVVGRHRGVRK